MVNPPPGQKAVDGCSTDSIEVHDQFEDVAVGTLQERHVCVGGIDCDGAFEHVTTGAFDDALALGVRIVDGHGDVIDPSARQ